MNEKIGKEKVERNRKRQRKRQRKRLQKAESSAKIVKKECDTQ